MELRKDYVLDRWVFFASGRKARPSELSKEPMPKAEKACFFCLGNEALTPPEVGRVSDNGKDWIIRWFLNKFPAVEEKGNPEVRTDNTFFTYAAPYGRHEIIAETPNHNEQLWDFKKEHIAKLLKVCFARVDELMKLPNIKFVSVFKNHRAEAGASLAHSHTQVAAISAYPPAIFEEVSAARRFGSCPYCRIIAVEKGSLRKCFENSSFVAFTPYASRFNYEVWIFPKRHVSLFSGLENKEVNELAEILGNVLGRLKAINAAYNFFLHYSDKDDLHAHIEVTPRLSVWAGFEFSTGAMINTVSPEDAAAFYRGEG